MYKQGNEHKQLLENVRQSYQYTIDNMKDEKIELEKLLISVCNKLKQVTDQIKQKYDEKKLYTQNEIQEVQQILNETQLTFNTFLLSDQTNVKTPTQY